MKLYDTIAAIATPIGIGGITIIRISGENAVEIASSLAKPKSGIALSEAESRKLYLCDIYDNGRLLDEALVTVMRAPASYTGEDVVEINCHGGYIAARSVLDAALTHGARLAEAGEFTRRAFINGKTDLTRVEATADLIDANSRFGAQNSRGGLPKKFPHFGKPFSTLRVKSRQRRTIPRKLKKSTENHLKRDLLR